MNNTDRYTKFALCREMMETVNIVANLPIEPIEEHARHLKQSGAKKIFISGEGSSRIFPAKRLIVSALRSGSPWHFATEGGAQSVEYDLKDHHVFIASNSGKTAEAVNLAKHLRKAGNTTVTAVVSEDNTPLVDAASRRYLLTCGKEDAVAATKSVIEQGLFYDILFRLSTSQPLPDLAMLAEKIEEALTLPVPPQVFDALRNASLLYFAGREDGVGEEITLKTNEITRRRSNWLEGTYAVHGIEEVMSSDEALIIFEPFEWQEQKFAQTLLEKIGIPIVAVSHRATTFPTMQIPSMEGYNEFIQLAAGWNLLVETGLADNIDLDTPVRARKVGNAV